MNVAAKYTKDRYVPGALVVAYALKKYKTRHDIILLHDNTLDPENYNILARVFTKVIAINLITDEETRPLHYSKQNQIYSPWIAHSYTKWNALGLTEYEKICFLDADNLPLENIDILLDEVEAPAGCFRTVSLPDSIGVFNHFPDNLNAPVPNELIKKALSGAAVLGASLVVLPTGRLSLYRNYIISGQFRRESAKMRCISGPDETSITMFMMNTGYTWHNIPLTFNTIPWKASTIEGVHMLTFTGQEKPWEMNPDKWPDLKIYYKLVKQLVKDYPDSARFFPHFHQN